MSLGPPQFHPLRVAEVRRETSDSVSIAFNIPSALQEVYRFVHGQHVTVRRTIGGEDVRRSYSICSGVDDGDFRIAVKRQAGGLFSGFANERLRPGDTLEVMTPTGHFTAPLEPGVDRTYLGIAAGSGITPLLSILKTVLAREPNSRFFLLYGNRTAQSIMFRETLEELKDRFLTRLSVTYVLSRETQEADALSGRIDAEKMGMFLRIIVRTDAVDHAFVCGPGSMLDAAQLSLTEFGVRRDRIHVERFSVDGTASPKRALAPPKAAERRVVAEAEAVLDGIRHRFTIGAEETVIEAGLCAGLELPYSCRGGMCCTCRARLVEGKVAMDVNYSLEPWELAAGYILTCQSRPETPRLVLDYDQV
jgi:ring-1,2-phenylacetyl-CoA epoxidase subunit PaaE